MLKTIGKILTASVFAVSMAIAPAMAHGHWHGGHMEGRYFHNHGVVNNYYGGGHWGYGNRGYGYRGHWRHYHDGDRWVAPAIIGGALLGLGAYGYYNGYYGGYDYGNGVPCNNCYNSYEGYGD